MLPDRLTRLLTAYVDGELRTHQRKAVIRLLRRSAQARNLLRQLQADANVLRSLPCPILGRDLSEPIMQRITGRPRRVVRAAGSYSPTWVGLATAAAVLLVLGLGSYLYYDAATQEENAPGQVKGDHTDKPLDKQAARKDSSTRRHPFVGPPAPALELVHEKLPLPSEEKQLAYEKLPLPGTTLPDESNTSLTSPVVKTDGFIKPNLKVALTLDLWKAKEWEHRRQEVLAELKNSQAPHRLDLGCLAASTAMERLQAAFKAKDLRLVIDQDAQNQLKLPLPGSPRYALYVENVTPDEVLSVFDSLHKEDFEARRRAPAQFNSLVLKELTAADQGQLKMLLGADPTKVDVSKPKAPLGADIRKPLAADTEMHVVDSLKGLGPARPEPGKQAKGPERLALVVSWNATRTRSASQEVKYFLHHRTERKAGTVQLLLILTGNKG